MLETRHLSVSYGGAAAVRDVSLRVEPGDRLGIVGESGSGKSTLALAMMGMTAEAASTTGSLRIDGREMIGAAEKDWQALRGSTAAMIFQEPLSALNPLKRVGDIVAEPLRVLDGLSRSEARAKVLSLFREVGLPDPDAKARQYPHELSGGQRQRVLIALALARDPAILIADEPTTALDAQVALRIVNLLMELTRKRGMALVFISHDLSAVARATGRIAVMYGGDIVEAGQTGAILASPRHPYTAGLIAARPRIDAGRERRQRMPTIPGSVPPLSEMAPGCRFAGRCSFERDICRGTRPPVRNDDGGRMMSCHLPAGATMPARVKEPA